MASFGINFDESESIAALMEYLDSADDAVADATFEAGQVLLDAWKDGGIPEDTGQLRYSGYLVENNDGSVEIGHAADYATYVELLHPENPRYLENTIGYMAPELARVAEEQYIESIQGRRPTRRYPEVGSLEAGFDE